MEFSYSKIVVIVGLVVLAGVVIYQLSNRQTPAELAQPNLEAGEAFLTQNATQPNIQRLPNGLQYEVLKEGTGPQPTINSKVQVHYRGSLIDGSEFDSSYERGQPATFPLAGVISGWQQGIPLMKEGAKYRFFIPNSLAYGLRSPSPKIPPGATLIFEVELLQVFS